MTDSAERSHAVSEESPLWKGDLAGVDHAVLRVPDLDDASIWYRNVLGVVVVERRSDRVFLASPVTGRIVLGLAEGGTGLDYVSFRARGADAFERVIGRARAAGIGVKTDSKETRPGATDARRVALPTGHTLEVITAEPDTPQLVEGQHRPGAFDVRPSHIQFRTTDVAEMSDFLAPLGFRVSTYVPLPGGDNYFIQFLRVNEHHHQLAILTGEHGIHHYALEVDEIDLWRLLDNLALYKIPAEYGPLRHHEGGVLSLYLRDPFGNRLEITGPMGIVGFDAAPHTADHEPWYHMNMWGPQPPESWETEWM